MIKIYTTLLIVLFTISCQVAPVQQEQPRSTDTVVQKSENEFSGKIVGIADGDTATVLDESNAQHKIRFLGIDAPEKAQAFGQKSKQNLSDLIFGKTVAVQVLKRENTIVKLQRFCLMDVI